MATHPLPDGRTRIESIDILRGLIMIIMALDHVREFFSRTPFQPEDLTQASSALFLTRWITNFCAPVFLFLSGMSMRLYETSRPKKEVSIFLLKRGAWLIFLEVTVINFLWQFGYDFILLEVIWAIGCSMIFLAALIWLPKNLLITVVVIIIAGHNLISNVPDVTLSKAFLAALHNSPFIVKFENVPLIIVAYAIFPWAALMAAGYWMGDWYYYEESKRRKFFRVTGIVLILLFIVIRMLNVYGDPFPWEEQPRGTLYSFLSFINVTKRPPSLQYILLMMGPALIVLSYADRIKGILRKFALVFGQVPLFFFILHIFLISACSWIWVRLSFKEHVNIAFASGDQFPADYHPSLIRTYLLWVLAIVVFYFPCRWYASYKKNNKKWLLSYL